MMELPPGYTWEQRDACELRCERCGDVVPAGAVDLHERRCRADPDGGVDVMRGP